MAVMQEPMVYVATPIDRGGVHSLDSHQIVQRLFQTDLTCYVPAHAWSIGKSQDAIQAVNDLAIALCDGMIAYLPDDAKSIGVPMEIERARGMGKPVALVAGQAARQSTIIRHRGVSVFDESELTYAIVWLKSEIATIRDRETPVQPGPPPLDPSTPHHNSWAFWVEVAAEIDRAAAKYANMEGKNTPEDWFAIFVEESLEVAQSWTEYVQLRKSGEVFGPPGVLSSALNQVRLELIQAAAMATRFWESI